MSLPPIYLVLILGLACLHASADSEPGHSSHGEAFNEGPRQSAVLIPECGKVSFTITTKKSEAQAFFNQGIGQLHGFWYFEAERSFRQVALLDKDCAMAFWGMAMANVNNEKRAKEFVKKATASKGSASQREKLWIATLENFYRDEANDKRDKKLRALDYIKDLETIVQDFPDDVEAKAFLVWKTWHANDVAPITSYVAVNALLDQVFAVNPAHPAHHYRIHLWDSRKPLMALKSAAQVGQSAPSIAHMWHMPGHTFSKLKRYDDAAWQQEASTRVDHAYMIKNWILPDQIHNYAHNEEWLVRTFNEQGRAKDAIGLATSLIRVPRHPTTNTLDKESCTASYGRTRLIETLIKWEQWDELLRVTDGPLIGSVVQLSHEAVRLRARGVAYFFKEDDKGLQEMLTSLEAAEAKDKAEKAEKAAKAEKEAKEAKAKASKETKSKVPTREKRKLQDTETKTEEAPKKPIKKADVVAKALMDLRALVAVRTRPLTAGVSLTKAADMPKELAIKLWLKLADKKKAEEMLKNLPQDLSGMMTKTEVQHALGKDEDAKKTFAEVKKIAFAMDGDLPVKVRLDLLAKEFGETAEWRSSPPKREDSGKRPGLETLGPIYWQPPTAPKWEAITLEGKPATSAPFEGKPHIILFYLGSACTHCMTQVNAFAKAAPDFEKAGISLVAITPEPLSLASRITEKMITKKLPAFPILCDPSQATFKSFRAYDDFEEESLHEAVLIDAQGRLRWIDISWQPFTDTAFLLKEAQRLLNLPE